MYLIQKIILSDNARCNQCRICKVRIISWGGKKYPHGLRSRCTPQASAPWVSNGPWNWSPSSSPAKHDGPNIPHICVSMAAISNSKSWFPATFFELNFRNIVSPKTSHKNPSVIACYPHPDRREWPICGQQSSGHHDRSADSFVCRTCRCWWRRLHGTGPGNHGCTRHPQWGSQGHWHPVHTYIK